MSTNWLVGIGVAVLVFLGVRGKRKRKYLKRRARFREQWIKELRQKR